MGRNMDSSSDGSMDEATRNSTKVGSLYMDSDDSATTIDDEVKVNGVPTVDAASNRGYAMNGHAILSFSSPFSHGEDAAERAELLLLAWVLLLHRGNLSDEALAFTCTSGGGKASNQRVVVKALVSDLVTESDEQLDQIRQRIRHLGGNWNELTKKLDNGFELATISPEGDTSDRLLSIDVQTAHDEISIRVNQTPLETTPDMVEIYIEALVDILECIMSCPKQTARQAATVHKRELAHIWSWGAQVPPTLDRSMHEDFVKMAQQYPEKPAVVSWDGHLSYAELDQLSTNLAVHLASIGVSVGQAVPFCFEKSAWTVVAVLAVMKAGGTFVLTDPKQPESRLQTIVEEVGAKVVLTSSNHAELGARIAPSAQIIPISPDFLRSLDKASSTDLGPVPGSATMYIIFTSGSTGKPKGVMLSHANYTSGAIPRADAVGYRSHTRVLDFASYAFDVSIDCMICTLAVGGCICVPSNDQRVNDLSGAIREMKVNMVHTTPSVARVLDADIIPSLEVLGLGGEALSARDAEKWNKQTHIINAYGPSECTVGCAINNNIPSDRSYVSLGRGVGGILWIVNPENHDELSPVGAVGELIVEGPIVGLGYVNEPEKTAAVYIEDPDWLTQGNDAHNGRHARLYKTGDLVKYDPDASGCVVFVGRKDQQVKIRGQRVELGEVEHHLTSKLPPKTAVAAEVIRPGGSGDPTLVAFIADPDMSSSTDGSPPSFSAGMQEKLADIEKVLAVEAPVYMIPSAYIPLRTMPIMVSGKTDRKQLRAMGSAMSRQQLAKLRVSSNKRRAPGSQTEKLIAELWVKLLPECDEVGLDDSFFVLGGDSLKSMKLVAAAREKGISLSVATIFANPTLAGMASKAVSSNATKHEKVAPFSLLQAAWTAEKARGVVSKLCDLSTDQIEDVLPCTPLQEILMAFSAKVSEAYVAQRVQRLSDTDAARKLEVALTKTVAECDVLRTRIVHMPGQGLVQVVSSKPLRVLRGQNLKEYVKLDQAELMTLGTPLARFAIIDDQETGSPHFVLTMHHALYDGWSMPLVVERLNRAHAGLETKRAAGFADYIKYLQEMDQESSGTYWREHLDSASDRQFPPRAKPGYQPKADSLLEQYIALGKTPGSTSTTVATIVRAAWAIVSAECSGSTDVIFGETLTGRNAPIAGVEEIEGPMITTVPVRINVDADVKVTSYLQSIQDQTVTRIPHEHFGLQNMRKLSTDAKAVYNNMFSGIVLHPYAGEDEVKAADEGAVAGLMPVNDTEAAREALKFNSYAVMLVCTLDPKGTLVMASFDSSIVPEPEMRDLLKRLEVLVQQLSQGSEQPLKDFIQVSGSEGRDLLPVSSMPKKESAQNGITNGVAKQQPLGEREELLKAVWSRLLEVDAAEIGPEDSFFDLGGDSIAAMKLASEVRQAGYAVSVAQMFETRGLREMAAVLRAAESNSSRQQVTKTRYSTLDVKTPQGFVNDTIRPALSDSQWEIEDVLPARPLQKIAVDGTIKLPRYSARYELFYFDQSVDKKKLFQSCQQLVDRNEVLRTVFVEAQGQYFGVVLKELLTPTAEYEIKDQLEEFSHRYCDLDVYSSMPLGSAFVKFTLVQEVGGRSCLIFRISHAQYDEICLPIMLRQLSALYEDKPVEESKPFSDFVRHIVKENIPASKPYWQELLKGSQMTKLAPDVALTSKKSVAFQKTVDISKRPKRFTLATFPSAAWALCLARHLHISDVLFGEVASGRNTGFQDADRVVGPCWQYIPCRVKFGSDWTAADLLRTVQEQHITSGQFEGMGLTEIVEQCTDWPKSVDWFDSVVHQDVAHVEELTFSAASSRMETVYPHLEPLRELKFQAFNEGDRMTLEIVTYESWSDYAQSLLQDLGEVFEELIQCSETRRLLS